MSARVHPKYGAPWAPDSHPSAEPGADGTWIFAHSLGAPYRDFYAIDNECRIFSLSKRNFVTPNEFGKISFGCGVGRNSADPNKPLQRMALEVALRSYFPDHAPPDPTKQFRVGHIDGNHQNNSIFNLHWISYNRVEEKKKVIWPAATADEKADALRQVQRMYAGYKRALARPLPASEPPAVVKHSVPAYGEFTTGWRDVIWPRLEKGMYMVNEKCQVFSVRIGRPVQPTVYGQVLLSNTSNGETFKILARTVMLRSFYPQKYRDIVVANPGITQRDITVDHVNGVHTDDRLENLQFLTRSDNARKGTGVAFVREPPQPQQSLDGEIWKTSPALQAVLPGVMASNMGRVKFSSGWITRGTKISSAPKYRILWDGNGHIFRPLLHHIVFMAFNNREIEEGFTVSHDRNAPMCEDGTYRSYPQDISLRPRAVSRKRTLAEIDMEDQDAGEAAAMAAAESIVRLNEEEGLEDGEIAELD